MTTKGTGPIPIANDLLCMCETCKQNARTSEKKKHQSYARHKRDNRRASKGLLCCVESVTNGDE